jgi:hypothetical protein
MASTASRTTSPARDADPARATADAPKVPRLAPTVPGLVQRSCACGSRPGVDGSCTVCRRRKRLGGVQTSLQVNRPGDRFEREADRIARSVARMPVPANPQPCKPTEATGARPAANAPPITRLARRVDALSLPDDEPVPAANRNLSLNPRGAGRPDPCGAPADAHGLVARVQSLEGRGRPLDLVTRTFFEARLGSDLGRVRVHTGRVAAALAGAVSAKAFTYGRNIAFGEGRFAPSTRAGRALLAHELTHTLQQAGANAGPSIQRAFTPVRGGRRVCPPPPSARRQGVAAHRAIQTKFMRQGGRGRTTELTLPFTDTAACRTVDRYEPPTSRGRVDLAIAERRGRKVSVRLGEIKPYNVQGMSAGIGVMACYENAIRRLEDVCVPGPTAMAGTRDADAIPLCRRLHAFTRTGCGRELEVGSSIRWQPGTVTMRAQGVTRTIGTANLGGVIGYFCPEKLLEESRRAARRSAKQAARKGTKGALKKLVPGAAYLEAGMLATVLLAGCRPTFGGEGVDLEEAFLHVLQHGPAPDVAIPDHLKRLLEENPELMERVRELERGDGDGDAAAREMLDLLEANKDLVDAEMLEFLVSAMEGSERRGVSRTGEEFRETLERIRAGAGPGTGATGEPDGAREAAEAPDTAPTAPAAPEPASEVDESPERAPEEGPDSAPAASASGRAAQRTVERRGSEPQRRLFEHIRDRVGVEGDEAFAKRFLEETQMLSETDVRAILEHLERRKPTTLEEVLQSIREALTARPVGDARLERLRRKLQDPTWHERIFERLKQPLQFYVPQLLRGRTEGDTASDLLILARNARRQKAAGYVDLKIVTIKPPADVGPPKTATVEFTSRPALIDIEGAAVDLGFGVGAVVKDLEVGARPGAGQGGPGRAPARPRRRSSRPRGAPGP